MKKFLMILFLTTYMIIGLNVNANAATSLNDNLNKPTIEQVIVNVPSNIFVYPGDSLNYNIRTLNRELYNSIKTKIIDNKLLIEFDNYELLDNYINPKDIKINIQAPNEIKIRTNSDKLVAESEKKLATNYAKK